MNNTVTTNPDANVHWPQNVKPLGVKLRCILVLFNIVLLPVVTTHVVAGFNQQAGTRTRVPLDSNERRGAVADDL
jgi:hypothetical protein